jgi:hypothetical protein
MIVVRDNGRSLLVSDKQWSEFQVSAKPVQEWQGIDYFLGWKEWLPTQEDDPILPEISTAKVCKSCDYSVCCGEVSK